MTTVEMDAFIQTDEGRAWLDGQKKPLLDKRDELLGEIKTRDARHAEAVQRAALAEKLLADQAAQRVAEEAEKKREGLRALAAKLAADEGIALDPERFIGADEETTRTLVATEAERFKTYAEAVLKAKYGNTGAPKSGTSATPPAMPFDAFENLSAESKMDFMRKGGSLT
jgi:hypothetical protein